MKPHIAISHEAGQAPLGLRAVFLAVAIAAVLAAQAPILGLAAQVIS